MADLIDLFAGCGGFTAGFALPELGFRPVAAVEHDLCAAATYAANFGEDHMHWIDIASFADVPRAEVVIGGPPCQGFSNLGSKDPDDPRNSLWREYERVVVEANPEVFVLENVQRFERSTEFALLMTSLAGGRLRKWKHHATAVLNAADYGTPQRRLRTIVIASRVGPIDLPAPTHSKSGTDGLPRWRSVRYAIGRMPKTPRSMDLPDRSAVVFGRPVPGSFSMQEIHLGRSPTERSIERYRAVPPGGGRLDLPPHLLPPCWARKPSGTTDVMGRLRWDEPSLTIRTEFFKPEKGRYLHPHWHETDPSMSVDRPITHREAAALQTFPDDFRWVGGKVQIARQIGNAVPVRLAEAIAASVRQYLR